MESPQEAMKEMVRVLKPGGVLAISVPRYLPERICWLISSEYHNVAGGHKRIFNHNQLKRLAETEGVKYQRFHWAHALHSPYWWLKCLFWGREKDHRLVELYHQFLIWDLMKKPLLTRFLEKLLQALDWKKLGYVFFQNIMTDLRKDRFLQGFYRPYIGCSVQRWLYFMGKKRLS